MYLTLIVAIVTSKYIFRCSKVSILIENIYISKSSLSARIEAWHLRLCNVENCGRQTLFLILVQFSKQIYLDLIRVRGTSLILITKSTICMHQLNGHGVGYQGNKGQLLTWFHISSQPFLLLKRNTHRQIFGSQWFNLDLGRYLCREPAKYK